MQRFIALALILALPSLAMAAADEAVVKELAKQTGLTPDDIREHHDGCDSGIGRYMKICGSYEWTKEDMRLNQIYARVRAKAKKEGYEAGLVGAQRAWLAYRDSACQNEADMGAGAGTDHSLFLFGCKIALTKERANRLQAMLNE